MGTGQTLRASMGDNAWRHRSTFRRPLWIIILLPLVSILLFFAIIFSPLGHGGCHIFSHGGCKHLSAWLPPVPAREYTDEEMASHAVIRDILRSPAIHTKNPKLAFMFLTPRSLPFEKLWDKFFDGHDGKFTIYVHSSKEKSVHGSRYFIGRDIRSDRVAWGKISMVDAEKRLLANALEDADNQHFVLLSDSCIPLLDFDYVYDYLMNTNVSFIDCFLDPGPHGNGRYSDHMLPEIQKEDFRKGAQWFTMKRQHALIVMADALYYSKFRSFCKPGFEGLHCYSDEHYLPTFFHMIDPGGIANWSVTHVDWSERKWHPKSYEARDVTLGLLENITSIEESVHVTSEETSAVESFPCIWNGVRRPCYLFARKFKPETLGKLMQLVNFTSSS